MKYLIIIVILGQGCTALGIIYPPKDIQKLEDHCRKNYSNIPLGRCVEDIWIKEYKEKVVNRNKH